MIAPGGETSRRRVVRRSRFTGTTKRSQAMLDKQPRSPEFQRLFGWLGLVLGAIATLFVAITLPFAKNLIFGIALLAVMGGATLFCGIGLLRHRRRPR